MARTKSNAPKDTAANVGFEANLWFAAGNLQNNVYAAD